MSKQNNVFYKNIKTLLKIYNISMKELEDYLHCSSGYLSRCLSNNSKKRLSVDIALDICNLFDVSFDTLSDYDLENELHNVIKEDELIDLLMKELGAGYFEVGVLPDGTTEIEISVNIGEKDFDGDYFVVNNKVRKKLKEGN